MMESFRHFHNWKEQGNGPPCLHRPQSSPSGWSYFISPAKLEDFKADPSSDVRSWVSRVGCFQTVGSGSQINFSVLRDFLLELAKFKHTVPL